MCTYDQFIWDECPVFNQFDTSSASLSFSTSCPPTAERSCRLTWWTLDCKHLNRRGIEIHTIITHLFAVDCCPYMCIDCNNNLLITGTSSGKILLYWRISWKHLVARYRNTDDTFTSSFTDVRIRRQAIFFDSWSASSLKESIARELQESVCKCNWMTYVLTTIWSTWSILFCTIIVGMVPHSFSICNNAQH